MLTSDGNACVAASIVRHTMEINGRRSEPIRWKYYQYTALLFTEIFLHWYFKRPADLLESLKAWQGILRPQKTEADFAAAHVLLQKDEPETYIEKLFEPMLGTAQVATQRLLSRTFSNRTGSASSASATARMTPRVGRETWCSMPSTSL